MEILRDLATFPKSYIMQMIELDSNFYISDSRNCALNHL